MNRTFLSVPGRRAWRRPAMLLWLAIAAPLQAATFTVSQTGGGPAQSGSLAWAVTQSNATAGGPHTIRFTTLDVQVNPTLGLVPPITRGVIIDGEIDGQPDVDIRPATGMTYTAPIFDIHTNQLVILRHMRIGGAFRNAVYVAPGSDSVILHDLDTGSTHQACLHLRGTTSILRVVAKDCGRIAGPGASPGERSGLWVQDADNVTIQASFIGIDADGNTPQEVSNYHYGIYVEGAENIVIGGVGVNRNVISNNQLGGVLLNSVVGASIMNNYIGVDPDGEDAIPNGYQGVGGDHRHGGIVLERCSDIDIGSANTPSQRGNVIAASGTGIRIHSSHDIRVHGNTIGTNASQTGGWPTLQTVGIWATGSTGSDGFTYAVDVGDAGNDEFSNAIGFHLYNGVRLESNTVGEFGIRNNSIWQNGEEGIALINGANSGIATPTILAATTALVNGNAPLNVAQSFGQVDVYRDQAGEGRVYLGTAAIDPDFGTWSLPVNLAGFEGGWHITATANAVGLGTSQFSPPRTISPGIVDLIFDNGFELD